jgi:hypothetical protein
MSEDLEKLKAFYEEVKNLTLNHAVVDDTAVVFPSDLGVALQRIDPTWYKTGTVEIKENSDGEAYIQLPVEMVEDLGWNTETPLEWIENDDGSISLVKAEEK